MELPGALRGRYQPLAVLGEGSFGAVWQCRDLDLGRELALKLLTLGDDEEAVQRFQREARVTAALRHPHVVEVYDHGVADGVPWIAYALLAGQDLDAWHRQHGRPGPDLLGTWAVQGAEALAAAHQAGLVHRDVKPANLLVRSADRSLVLVDFGIARAQQRGEGTLHTAEGVILGTPAYMAPELFQGHPPSPASDQWAWAAVLAELNTGSPPYGTYQPGEVVRAAASFRPGHGLAPGTAGAVLRRALAADPARRFPDMGALADALRAVSWEGDQGFADRGPASDEPATMKAARPVAARPASATPPAWPFRLGAAALLALGVGLGWAVSPSTPPTRPALAAPVTLAGEVAREPAAALAALASEVREAEEALRILATPRGPSRPWEWLDFSPPGTAERTRAEARELYRQQVVSDSWARLTTAVGDWLVVLDGLDHTTRAREAPEVYRDHRAVLFLARFLGRTRALAKVHLENYDPATGHPLTPQEIEQTSRELERITDDISWHNGKRRRLALELKDRLLEIPDASPAVQRMAWILQLACRGEGFGQAFQEVLARLPSGDVGTDLRLTLELLDVLSNEGSLWGEESCARGRELLPRLRQLTLRAEESWGVELTALALVVELAQARRCPGDRGPELVARCRVLVERLLQERAKIGGPPGGLANKHSRASMELRLLGARLEEELPPLRDLLERVKPALAAGPYTP